MVIMIEVTYPSDVKRYFIWIKGKYGYFRNGNKIFRYPLPKKQKDISSNGNEGL
jgi:hypothetical protein